MKNLNLVKINKLEDKDLKKLKGAGWWSDRYYAQGKFKGSPICRAWCADSDRDSRDVQGEYSKQN